MGISLKLKEFFLVGSCEVHSTLLGLEKAGADNTVAHNLLAQFGMGNMYLGS